MLFAVLSEGAPEGVYHNVGQGADLEARDRGPATLTAVPAVVGEESGHVRPLQDKIAQ